MTSAFILLLSQIEESVGLPSKPTETRQTLSTACLFFTCYTCRTGGNNSLSGGTCSSSVLQMRILPASTIRQSRLNRHVSNRV